MQAFEYIARVGETGTLTLPDAALQRIAGRPNVRVLLLLDDDDEENLWRELVAERFLSGYAESDAIYDSIQTP